MDVRRNGLVTNAAFAAVSSDSTVSSRLVGETNLKWQSPDFSWNREKITIIPGFEFIVVLVETMSTQGLLHSKSVVIDIIFLK
jgi:hypothetical protein